MKKYILGSIVILLSNSFVPVSFAVEQPTSESAIDADEAITTEDTDPSIDLIDEPILEVINPTLPEEALDLEIQDGPVEIEDGLAISEKSDFEETEETIIDSGELPDGGWIFYENGTLAVTGTILLDDFKNWSSYSRRITSIEIINSKMTGSYSKAFVAYTNLDSFLIMDTDISDVTSMSNAFSDLLSLQQVTFKNIFHNSMNPIAMSYMFYRCKSLRSLIIDSENRIPVSSMDNMFWWCEMLREIDLNSFDTSSTTSMRNMFYMCSRLTKVELQDLDTSSVWNMSSMFSNCSNLTSLNLSNFDTSSVTNMSSMFESCTILSRLDLSNFDTGSVKSMRSMFRRCSKLVSLDLSSFNTIMVTNMSLMFGDCEALKEIKLTNFTTSSVEDMSSMFANCRTLTELDLSRFNTSLVTTMNNMFENCSSLEEIDLSSFDTNYSTLDHLFSRCHSLTTLTLGHNFLFLDENSFPPTLSGTFAWQEKRNNQLLYSTLEMTKYHNDSGMANTYVIVSYFNLEMDALGGNFEDEMEIKNQRKATGDNWDVLIPTKENFQFDGWYLDKEYKRKFDFDQPVSKNVIIYAKWIENYVVTIPEKIELNSEDELLISGLNNGDKSLSVTIKHEESQINQSRKLKLTNQLDQSSSTNVQLEWEEHQSEHWTILTIPADSAPTSKDSTIKMIKPKDIQAGDYSGQIVFSISYE